MGVQLASAAAPRLNPISFRKSLRLASPRSQPSPSPPAPSRSLSMSSPPSALVMAFTAIQSADGRVELAAAPHRGRGHPLAAVAVEAPAHDQRLLLTYPFHGLHRPVAALAGHPAAAHVLAVAEEDEVRQLVDPGPADGPPLGDGLLELLHLGRGHLELAVAVHAHAFGGDAGVAALLGREVAVLAGDAIVAGVDAVGEGDRLRRLVPLADPHPLEGADEEYRGQRRQPELHGGH